ncbi:MAG: DUF6056 family protein, partial [Bacteroidota bacterium]
MEQMKVVKAKYWNIIIYGAACFLLLPIFLSAFLNHPLGSHDWDWPVQFGKIDYTFWQHQVYHYQELSGRYFTTFLLGLTPYWFNLATFKFFPILLIISTFFGLFYLFRSLPEQISRKQAHLLSLLILLLWFSGLSGMFEMVYTLSSGFQYWSACILFLFWLGLFLRVERRRSVGKMLILLLLTISVNASNEINMLLLNLSLLFYAIPTFITHKKMPQWLLLLGGIALASSLIMVLAPANFKRIETYPGSGNVLFALGFALPVMIQNFITWLVNTPIVALSILLWRPAKNIISTIGFPLFEKVKLKWILGTTFALQYFPLALLFYASGPNSLPERIIDVLYLQFILSWFLILGNLIKNHSSKVQWAMPAFLEIGLAIYVFLFVLFNPLKINRTLEGPSDLSLSSLTQFIEIDNNFGQAWLSILDGSAVEYHRANLTNYELLKQCKTQKCYLPKPKRRPPLLQQDIFDRRNRPDGENNMSWYFNGKQQW